MVMNRRKKFLVLAVVEVLIPYIANAEDTVVVSADSTVTQTEDALSKQTHIGLLGSKVIHDTPFSIKVYNSRYIENRQAKSLGDVIKMIHPCGLPLLQVGSGFFHDPWIPYW